MEHEEDKYLQRKSNQVHNSSGSRSVKLIRHNYKLTEAVRKQLLGNIFLAVGLFEGKIELVFLNQHIETFRFYGMWTLLGATLTLDIHRDVFLHLLCVILSRVVFATVRYEPRHL